MSRLLNFCHGCDCSLPSYLDDSVIYCQDCDPLTPPTDDFVVNSFNTPSPEPQPARTPAATSFINSIAVVKLTGTILDASQTCAICTDEFKLDEEMIINQLSCGHYFHSNCIVKWLKRKNNCPMCRHEFPRESKWNHRLLRARPENNGIPYNGIYILDQELS